MAIGALNLHRRGPGFPVIVVDQVKRSQKSSLIYPFLRHRSSKVSDFDKRMIAPSTNDKVIPLPQHLYDVHYHSSGLSQASKDLIHGAPDDIREFRSNLLHLSEAEMTQVIAGVESVRQIIQQQLYQCI